MNDTDKKPKARAIPKPHLDPMLILFSIFAIVLLIAKLASAQPVTPAAVPAGGTLTGIPALDAVIQLGVPAGLAVYLVVWGFPKLVADFRTEAAAIRAEHAEERKTDRDDRRAEMARLEQLVARDRGPVPPA